MPTCAVCWDKRSGFWRIHSLFTAALGKKGIIREKHENFSCERSIPMQLDKKLIHRIFLCLAGLLFLAWFLTDTQRVQTVVGTVTSLVAPFVMGAAVAFVFNVPMRGVERQLSDIRRPGLRRGAALILTIGLIVLVIAGVVLLLIPQIQKTVDSLSVRLPQFIMRVGENAVLFLEKHPELKDWVAEHPELTNVDWNTVIQKAFSFLGDSAGTIVDSAFSAIGSVTGAVVDVFISIFFAIYCLTRKEILARQGRRILYSFLPERAGDEIVRILRLTNATFSKFISGQCLEACILGCLFAVAMMIFGMPYVALVSVIIAVTALVPVVGAFVGCILGAFFILVDSPIQALSFVAMFLVIQQLENNLIYPRVVGTSIGLPGMWVLVAVTVGGGLMGVGGMLVMIPLTSVLYTLLGEYTSARLTARKIPAEKLQDQPPDLQTAYQKRRQRIRLEKMRLNIQKKKDGQTKEKQDKE